MPRTEVYQLRLTKAEKDELASRAKLQGVSIAKLIRQRLALDAAEEPLAKPGEVIEVKGSPEDFTQRVAFHKLRMPLPAAERLARQELSS